MKEIKILYFAYLKEKACKSEEHFKTNALTAQEVYLEIEQKYHFDLELSSLKVAINHEFSTWDCQLKSGDILAFLSPVSGG